MPPEEHAVCLCDGWCMCARQRRCQVSELPGTVGCVQVLRLHDPEGVQFVQSRGYPDARRQIQISVVDQELMYDVAKRWEGVGGASEANCDVVIQWLVCCDGQHIHRLARRRARVCQSIPPLMKLLPGVSRVCDGHPSRRGRPQAA